MLSIEVTVFAAIAYLAVLFVIAYRGDKSSTNTVKPYRYSLAQGVHCTSWGFFWHCHPIGLLRLGICSNLYWGDYRIFAVTRCSVKTSELL